MDEGCINLNFLLGSTAVGTTAASRNWNIQVKSNFFKSNRIYVKFDFLQVTQYDCNYNNLAPDGCTQYYFGSDTGTVQTYRTFKNFFPEFVSYANLRLYSFLVGKNNDTLYALQAIGPHIQCTCIFLRAFF